MHNAIKHIDKGLFPNAFCKIVPDYLTEARALHRYACGRCWNKVFIGLCLLERNGRLVRLEGIAQDALIMNIDDLLCVGATDNILLSSTIGRNKQRIPGEVLGAIINGTEELINDIAQHGVSIKSTGGETADVEI